MTSLTRVCVVVTAIVPFLLEPLLAQDAKSDKWTEAMEQFESQDAKSARQPGGVVFVGSSSIRLWDLQEAFPDWNALNRGFGGSEMGDSVRYVELLVLKHQPRSVVVYAGDNDINAGKSPQKVSDDFAEFERLVHDRLPDTKIYYISIKPSTRRWHLKEPIQTTNGLISSYCSTKPNCQFVSVWEPMLGKDGTPRPELLQDDGLHLTSKGYAIWNKIIADAIGNPQ